MTTTATTTTTIATTTTTTLQLQPQLQLPLNYTRLRYNHDYNYKRTWHCTEQHYTYNCGYNHYSYNDHYTTTTNTSTTTTTTATTNYKLDHAPPHYIQQLWVRWPLQPLHKAQLQPRFGPSVDSLCHPCIATTHLSYNFQLWISATALCGTTGISLLLLIIVA